MHGARCIVPACVVVLGARQQRQRAPCANMTLKVGTADPAVARVKFLACSSQRLRLAHQGLLGSVPPAPAQALGACQVSRRQVLQDAADRVGRNIRQQCRRWAVIDSCNDGCVCARHGVEVVHMSNGMGSCNPEEPALQGRGLADALSANVCYKFRSIRRDPLALSFSFVLPGALCDVQLPCSCRCCHGSKRRRPSCPHNVGT
jgi:hypothetical protein